jgi:hypothetical protein
VPAGYCSIFIDGVYKTYDWHLDIEVEPGHHDIACHSKDGRQRTQSVRLKPGEIRAVYF